MADINSVPIFSVELTTPILTITSTSEDEGPPDIDLHTTQTCLVPSPDIDLHTTQTCLVPSSTDAGTCTYTLTTYSDLTL